MSDSTDLAIKVWSAFGATIGTVLGVFNFVHARNKEKRDRQREDDDFTLYTEFVVKQQEHPSRIILRFTPGSMEHRWAQRMVERGLLEGDGTGHGYSLPQRPNPLFRR